MSALVSAWTVTYLVHSTLLVAVVWAASRWIRSASVRDTLWKIALVGGIVTATVQLAVPVDRFLPRTAPRRVTMQMPALTAPEPAPLPDDTNLQRVATADHAATPSLPRPRPIPIVAIVWASLAALLVARIFVGRSRFLAAIADRVELLRGPERELIDRLAESARIGRPIRLTESGSVPSPVAMLGWEIVIPAGVFARLNEEQRETILAHELAHLVRRDPLWLTVAEGLKALLFFQPLGWLVQARMKETAEFLCDDAAVLQTGNRKALAETLAELAASVVPSVPAVAAMAEGGSHLIARVRRVLQSSGRPDSPLRLHLRLAIALLIVATTVALAPEMRPARRVSSSSSSTSRLTTARSESSPVMRASSVANAMSADGITTVKNVTTPRATTRRKLDGTTNHLADGVLTRSYQGPDGLENIDLKAHGAWIPDDVSWIEFDSTDGYVRAVHTAERGPKREAVITAGPNLEPVFRYTVDGIEHPWCDDARRVIVLAFRPNTTYADVQEIAERPKTHTWDGTISYTGHTDGEPTRLEIRAIAVRYDESGKVTFDDHSSLHVEEQLGDRKTSYHRTGNQSHFTSSENDGESTIEDQSQWLRELLRKHTNLPRKVIDALTRS